MKTMILPIVLALVRYFQYAVFVLESVGASAQVLFVYGLTLGWKRVSTAVSGCWMHILSHFSRVPVRTRGKGATDMKNDDGSQSGRMKERGMTLLDLPRDCLQQYLLGSKLLSFDEIVAFDFAFTNKEERPKMLEVFSGLKSVQLPPITDIKYMSYLSSRGMHSCLGHNARDLNVDIEGIHTPSQLWFAAAARNQKASILALKVILDMDVGISADHTDYAGRSVIHNATLFNQVDMVKSMTESLSCSVNIQDHNGDTPLHIAVRFNRLKCARELIKLGADCSIENHSGGTPLFVCSHEGHVKAAIFLLEKGADPNHHNITGDTPLIRACAYGHHDMAKLLIDNGVSVNQRNHLKTTPLHVSIHNGHTEITKLLLDYGADPNSPGRRGPGHTPLQQALNQKANDIAYVLAINYGADTSDCTQRPRRTAVQVGVPAA